MNTSPSIEALPRLFNLKEVASFLQITEERLRDLEKRGGISAVHVGPREIRFRQEDIDDFLNQVGSTL
jgi:excisionase family DNA binding protein